MAEAAPAANTSKGSAAWEAANDVVVEENVRTASMIVRKSLVERVMYCGGGVEVLDPAISDRAVGMGPEVSGEVKGIGATGAVVGGAEGIGGGTDEAGARGSPVCSAIGDRSPCGLSSAVSSSSDPRGGR